MMGLTIKLILHEHLRHNLTFKLIQKLIENSSRKHKGKSLPCYVFECYYKTH